MTQRLRALLLPLLASLLIVFAATEAGAEDRVVTSEGLAPVKADDTVAARNAAIENALRKAVEQVVAELIDSEIALQNYQTLNGSIYSKAQGFVHEYDVLKWNRDGAQPVPFQEGPKPEWCMTIQQKTHHLCQTLSGEKPSRPT